MPLKAWICLIYQLFVKLSLLNLAMASSTWEGARRLGAALLLTATAIAPVRASVELDLCASFNTASMDRSTLYPPLPSN